MSVLNPLPLVSLDDKYRVTGGTVLMNGVQALVRVPVLRRQIDEAQGLNTAGFISGYRGSPLGTYDTQLWAAKHLLTANHIRFQPGVNEDLGATAVWGTQQVNLFPGAKYDGVFGIWYGKSPGVDRSGDALRHANFAGTSKHGGVLALAGDDHGCKSSSLPSQSEHAFISAEIPVLCPADIEELVAFGVKGIALSRAAGLWVGMTTIADVLDSTATVMIDPALYVTVAPDVKAPLTGLHAMLGGTPILREEVHRHFRLPAAQAFARVNGFDRTPIDTVHPRIGIVAAGKSYLDVRQALLDLGINDDRARAMGLRLFKPGLTWPLDPAGLRACASGLEELIVIEERRDVLEQQIKAIAYDVPDALRPRIVGKCDEQGRPLISDLLELNSAKVARALAARFPAAWKTEETQARLAEITTRLDETVSHPPIHVRTPFFCSGCPHNTSTNLPEGSRAMAGIGCHYLVQWMDRDSELFTQMGGEGMPWIGAAPFTDEKHIFANLGDGTYFHSGSLAIRQAVAAGVNITYKILFNGAVAMTGGQPVDGPLTVPAIVQQMAAEGVTRIAIVADDMDRYANRGVIPSWVTIDHRDRLEAIQTELRDHPGCSILIYDQSCATERRRRRKRGLEKPETRRVLINEAVCEGCGDCSTQSNCVSIEPVETEFGRKRKVDQSTCNQDFSCLKGFCPSFVTVEGGKAQRAALPTVVDLPEPLPCPLGDESYNILLAGIGGQGVTSLSAMLAMAAHLDGREVRVADQLGMAQKGGSVHAHLRIGQRGRPIYGPRVGVGQADLILAADMVVAHGASILPMAQAQRTRILLNSTLLPTGEFVGNNEIRYDSPGMKKRLAASSLTIDELPAGDIATRHFGDALFSNIVMLGHAYQKGLMPLSADAIERAIELNGAAVTDNLAAFHLGRRLAVAPESLVPPTLSKPLERLDEVIARRIEELTAYQNAAYAARYAAFVEHVRVTEHAAAPGTDVLALTVARGLFKLMAYKDEYEVARLYTNGAFARQLSDAFGSQTKLRFHMAPPLRGKRDPDTGLPTKSNFGPWMMPVLRGMARLKGLRGTAFDPFGRTTERRQERDLIEAYRNGLLRILDRLTPETLPLAVDYARVAESIRGYGHIKAKAIEAAEGRFEMIEAQIVAMKR